jgi:hypothetical protein
VREEILFALDRETKIIPIYVEQNLDLAPGIQMRLQPIQGIVAAGADAIQSKLLAVLAKLGIPKNAQNAAASPRPTEKPKSMLMKQCEQSGHYYNAAEFSACPYCAGTNAVLNNSSNAPNAPSNAAPHNAAAHVQSAHTSNAHVPNAAPVVYTPPAHEPSASGRTVYKPKNPNEGRTVALIREELGVDPVVGWLINLDGKDKGKDYRIHADNNFIGRDEGMDVCIRGDDTISRKNHAIISYDSRDRAFYFSPGDGRNIVRLNDKAIFQTTQLKAYDTLEIGKTKLLFLPLCGEQFDWV